MVDSAACETSLLLYGKETYSRVDLHPMRSRLSPVSPRPVLNLDKSSYRSPFIGRMYLLNVVALIAGIVVSMPNCYKFFEPILDVRGVLPMMVVWDPPAALEIRSKKTLSVIDLFWKSKPTRLEEIRR